MTGSFLYFSTGFNKFIGNNLTVKREFYSEQNLQKTGCTITTGFLFFNISFGLIQTVR
jgi:hypothetical protein